MNNKIIILGGILLLILLVVVICLCNNGGDPSQIKNLKKIKQYYRNQDENLPTNRLRIMSISPHILFKNYNTLNTNNDNKDIIIIQPNMLKLFVDKYLPQLKYPVKLVFSDSGTNSSCKSVYNYKNFLKNPHIKHVFSENWWNKENLDDYKKITQIPIGIESKICSYYKFFIEDKLIEISKDCLSPKNKPLKVLCNAHLKIHKTPSSGRYNQRKECYDYLKNNILVDFWKSPKPVIETWKLHNNYSFELCPEGNGLDTHRFYEAILLNTIPIVKNGPLTPLYKKFPCVIVNEWDEINLENLKKWKNTIEIDKTPLKFSYWKKKIIGYK